MAWLVLAATLAPGAEVVVRGPLATQIPVTGTLTGRPFTVTAVVRVPADAPADLGIGAWASDKDGRWFQRGLPGVLTPGEHRIAVDFGADDPVTSAVGTWSAAVIPTVTKAGIFFWTTSGKPSTVTVDGLATIPRVVGDAAPYRVADLVTDPAQVIAGQRWSLRCLPQPVPANPYDPADGTVDLAVIRPDGQTESIPGFWDQPMLQADGGDSEVLTPLGAPAFAARYRPRLPGRHRLSLTVRWPGGHQASVALPDLEVTGQPWDGYVHVDRQDPRFFSLGSAGFWPVGINLRSVTDVRGGESTKTHPTPDRGTLAYEAYFARLAAHGVQAAEVWMSSWNLALEWDNAWPGFRGAGRYHEGNAWRLDRVLDLAHRQGIKVQLVLNNHGQGAIEVDREWANHPYNKANGGWLESPIGIFTDAQARLRQEQVRRYVVGRYADHPAILGWKLWTEMDLTEAGRKNQREVLAKWHEAASAHLKGLDIYDHPIATHWCGTYRNVYQEVAGLPGIDYLTIDAYHQPEGQPGGILLGQLLMAGINRAKGLGRFNKPVVVSEYGGDWNACPPPQLEAEHASGGFCALVSGYAAAPMLWWFEWVDQGARYAPYQALRAFIAGEDLRGTEAKSAALTAFDSQGDLWARAWIRPGRMLGYVMDPRWQAGGTAESHASVEVKIADSVNAGAMDLDWWDADRGTVVKKIHLEHPGGALVLHPPGFSRHLAFKLVRTDVPPK